MAYSSDCKDLADFFKKNLMKSSTAGLTMKGLLFSIFRLNSRNMTISLGLRVLEEWILKPCAPIIIGLLLRQINNPIRDTSKELNLLLIIAFIFMLRPFTYQRAIFLARTSGARTRNALTSVIYEKAMNLSHEGGSKTNVGHVLTLIANDVNEFDLVFRFLDYIITAPVQFVLVSVVLWFEMGPYTIIGVPIFLLLIAMQLTAGNRFKKLRDSKLEATDKRAKLMNDVLTGIKIIKMYGWEDRFAKLIAEKRKTECQSLSSISLLKSLNIGMASVSIKLLILITLIIHIKEENGFLSAEKVFVMLSLFYTVRASISELFVAGVNGASELYSSLQRIKKFLDLEEHNIKVSEEWHDAVDSPRVSIVQAYASWNKEPFLKNINIEMGKGELITIVGPVGSGKTSLLMLILRELNFVSGSIDINGSIAYVPQESWMVSDTIINNITLQNDNEIDFKKVQKVIDICALQSDIDSLPYGTETLVGERGVMLSGGQRARLSLARALYHDADIYLLDDPLSAVDSAVGHHIYNECIMNYMKQKICILVTHQIQYIKNDQKVIVMNKGRIKLSGNYGDISNEVRKFNAVMRTKPVQSAELETNVFSKQQTAKLDENKMDENTNESGNVGISWRIYLNYFKSGGNCFFIFIIVLFNFATGFLSVGSDYWLKFWTDEQHKQTYLETLMPCKQIDNVTDNLVSSSIASRPQYCENSKLKINDASTYFVLIYIALTLAVIIFGIFTPICNFMICTRASNKLHDNMFKKMLHVPLRFFNRNPTGRIMGRFTIDIGNVDENMPDTFADFATAMSFCTAVIIMICTQNRYLLLVVLLMVLLYLPVIKKYKPMYQHFMRIDNINRSPVFSHLTSSFDGRMTIRAFGAMKRFKNTFLNIQNTSLTSSLKFREVEAWYSFFADMIGSILVGLATLVPVFLTRSTTSGTVGFVLSQVAQIAASIEYFIRVIFQLQNEFISVERVMEYGNMAHESSKNSTENKKPASDWPTMGSIQFEDVSLKYVFNGPLILKNLNFKINSKEKIGVIGRTGAGKTSLINALFRLVEPEGTIKIDDVVINDIGLHDLRRKVSVIPQEPLLFADTLRYNLDPFEEYQDFDLWTALNNVNLKETVSKLSNGLNTRMRDGGTNLSYGQRQLVCLARVILKKNNILILDEATSNVDNKTDSLIQRTVRSKFRDCTVITIAHRLNTVIDCDRILVMDKGRIVEFDSPRVLARNENSVLYKMIQDTGSSAEILFAKALTKDN
ncbi:ABCC4 (predicted) [Pycnogonum litorale]